jgi:3-oxoadipate enol-lactonase
MRTETVMAGDVPIVVDVYGEGEPVTVVGHGLTGSRHEFEIFAPFLPGTKVLVDFRGHGDSGRPPLGNYTFDHFAMDMIAVADRFRATRAIGGSLGAGTILRILEESPDRFDRMVLLLPARLEVGDQTYKRLTHLADLLEELGPERTADVIVEEEDALGSFDEFPASRDYRRAAILNMNPDGVPAAIRGVVHDTPVRDPAAVREIAAPALIIAQEGDSFHSTDVATELAEALPNSELMVFPDQFAMLRDVPTVVQRVSAFIGA